MTPVKICGITRVEDAVLAADLGATWIGFVFWPRSPRCVTPAAAADILAAMPPQVTGVGVFVNQTPADVAATAAEVGLGAVQLHGDETPTEYVVGGRRVIKALRLSADSTAAAADTGNSFSGNSSEITNVDHPPSLVIAGLRIPGLRSLA